MPSAITDDPKPQKRAKLAEACYPVQPFFWNVSGLVRPVVSGSLPAVHLHPALTIKTFNIQQTTFNAEKGNVGSQRDNIGTLSVERFLCLSPILLGLMRSAGPSPVNLQFGTQQIILAE